MDWSGKKVLVTGSGGFIGSHLVERLVADGADVRAFVRYNSRSDFGMLEQLPKDVVEKLDVYPGDLKDSDAVRAAAKDMEIIFHLASLIAIPYSYIHPRETIENNVLGALNIMTAARDLDVQKVVHTSTSEVFGTAQYVPIDEKHPLNPQSPYAASKASADHIVQSFHLTYGVKATTLRPFNTFGPRQSARAVIPTIIMQALSRDAVHLGSLTPTRDYTYVADTVDGFVKAAECDAAVGQVMNIGNDREISIGELASKIIGLVGRDIPVVQDEQRLRPKGSEVQRLRVSNAVAKQVMGWEPKATLDEGLKNTLEWIKGHLELYKPERYIV